MGITLILGFSGDLRHFLGFNPNSRDFWSSENIFWVFGLFWGYFDVFHCYWVSWFLISNHCNDVMGPRVVGTGVRRCDCGY